MTKIAKTVIIALSIIFVVIIAIVTFYFFLLTYESKKDVSNTEPFLYYLNTPLEVKHVSTIRWNRDAQRFSNYSLNHNKDSNFNDETVKSVKKYIPGDKITFYAAKKYKSLHVGDTYYFLGKDTLSNGKEITFEYYYYDKYFYNIWETEEEFLERQN